MKFSLVFTLLLLLLLLPGCGCKDSEMATVLLSEEFKRYTDFPAGSWWVYEKIDEPEVTDSIYLYEYTNEILNDDELCIIIQIIMQRALQYPGFYSKPDTLVFKSTPTMSVDNYSDFLFNGNLLILYVDSSNLNLNVEIISKNKNEIVGNIEYFNTITTFHKSISSFIISETYAQDVGVVRRVYRDSSIYELKSYFINK